jgi:EAL domain-containing protein (putative c-di-GMP-specific phosphodiesterase class I)
VTESVFVNHSESRVLKVLNALRALGISLSLDDFGTGYSSLSYLNQLPFDQLKVDRSFVTDVHLDQKKARVLSGVIALGKGLGLKIVVEGVEKAEEAEFIRRQQVDAIQGYFYAKPMEAVRVAVEISRIRMDDKYKNLLGSPQEYMQLSKAS